MISIVGGGPSGSYLAYLLASEGKDVNVYEEHKVIGNPIQCTGLLTDSILDLVPIKKEFLVNTIKKARLFSPNGNFTDVKLRNNFVVDRHKFDSYLANMAIDKGANYFLSHKFLDCRVNKKISAKFQTKRGVKELQTDYLVGADGPRSSVGRSVGLVTEKRKYIVALQARIDLKNLNCEKDTFESFMERRGFGWVVPENDEVARVGIATVEKNANAYFQDFLKQRCPNKRIIEYQSGIVPIYTLGMKYQKDNVFLVGDAACQVKLSTHGGIILGMLGAEEVKNSIINNDSYDRRWKKRIGRDLYISWLIWKVLKRFSDEDYNNLINCFKNKELADILSKYNRDFPSQFIFKILLKKPSLLKYSLKLLYS